MRSIVIALALLALVPAVRATPEIALPAATNGLLAPGAADKIVTTGVKPVTNVLDVGGTPRADLSYALVKGHKLRIAIAMDMTMTVGFMGKTTKVAVPTTMMTFEIVTLDKNEAGQFRVEGTVTDVAVAAASGAGGALAPKLREQLAQLAKMKGLRVTYVIDRKGYLHDAKVDAPPDLPAEMQQTVGTMTSYLQSLAMPLPYEAVGRGARWQAFTRVDSNGNGVDVLQAATIALRERAGNTVTLDVAIRQLAASPTFTANGMTMKMTAFDSTGSGTVDIDLANHLPHRGRMAMKLVMDIEAGSMPMHMEMAVNITMKRL